MSVLELSCASAHGEVMDVQPGFDEDRAVILGVRTEGLAFVSVHLTHDDARRLRDYLTMCCALPA